MSDEGAAPAPQPPGVLEAVIDSVAEGVISLDEHFRIVIFNAAAESLFGRRAKEMIGRSLNDVIPERFRAQHDHHLHAFAASGETLRRMGQYGFIYGLHASGRELPLEAMVSQSGEAPHRRFTVILRDVSERLRAERELRRHAEQLRALSRRLFETEERERRRLSRELHDTVAQNVTALLLNLHLMSDLLPDAKREPALSRFSDCESLLHATDKLVRNLMANLRPPGLDELGLLAALSEHASQVARRGGVSINVTGAEALPRLPRDTETALFRIAQEALTNAVKHSGALEIWIGLEVEQDTVRLTVADGGCGFDSVEQLTHVGPSLGLVDMRERAEAVDGQLSIESAPGDGVRVIVQAPRTPRAPGGSLAELSRRERQILQLVAEGYSGVQIAAALHISPKTVDTYRGRLMQKLRIGDVAGLVKFAIQHGLTSLD